MDNIQSTLDLLTSQSDRRTSVFDIEIVRLQNAELSLSGRLLDESQLATLSRYFSKWKLDTSSIRILHRGNVPRMHVATNLTGLYDKPTFSAALSSELCYGTDLEILDEQGKWAFTRQADGYLGWAYKGYLADGCAPEPSHLVLVSSYGLRTKPERESEIVTRVVSGSGIILEDTHGEWALVRASREGWMPLRFLRPLNEMPASLEERRHALVEDSKRMVGVPYLWGGTSGNGIDCSGLARLLHRWIGIQIPRDSDLQHAAARPVEPPFEPGDLLFFAEGGRDRKITHVGISLGGWKMVHSSRSNNGVYIDDVQERSTLHEVFVSGGSFLR